MTALPPEALARLHDIVEPAPLPTFVWPPPPGWLWLAVALILSLALALGWLRRRRRGTAWRRQALRELATLRARDFDAATLAELATLLRRVALNVAPRAEVAALHGAAWCDWLSQRGPPLSPAAAALLCHGLYARAQPDRADAAALLAWAQRWITVQRRGSAA